MPELHPSWISLHASSALTLEPEIFLPLCDLLLELRKDGFAIVVWPLGPPNHVQITCPGEKRAGCGPRHLWIFCSLSHSTDGRRGEAMEPWTGVWIYDMMTI